MARPASQVSRLGFPVPQPSRPRLDSSFHASCCNRVPSLISFTNGPVCPGHAGLGQGQKGSVSAKGVTSWLSQLPGVSLEYLPRGPGPWKQVCCPGEGGREHLQTRSSGDPPPSPAALAPLLPCQTTAQGQAQQDILSTSFCLTCPSGLYGAANADRASTLHQHQAIRQLS